MKFLKDIEDKKIKFVVKFSKTNIGRCIICKHKEKHMNFHVFIEKKTKIF